MRCMLGFKVSGTPRRATTSSYPIFRTEVSVGPKNYSASPAFVVFSKVKLRERQTKWPS